MWLTVRIESKDFGEGHDRRRVLGKFDLSIDRGKFLAVVGQSGSGKSSLLRIIAGLEDTYSGSVQVGQHSVTAPTRRVGLMFQDTRLFPWMNVAQNVRFALPGNLSNREKDRRVGALLGSVSLSDRSRALPKELSGGMIKRVGLARTLVNLPELLLLDEPFAGLDWQSRMRLIELAWSLHEKNRLTSILVTHDLDEALLLADGVAVLAGDPATLGATRLIDLPRPRQRASADYQKIRDELMTKVIGS